MPGERWRDVPGYEGSYQVSDRGRVYSIRRSGPGTGGTGRIRALYIHPRDGYLMASLTYQNKTRSLKVHLLVARAFLGPCPPKQEVRHLNADKTDSRLVNLRYGTHKENMQDMEAHGNGYWSNKTHCPAQHEYTEENTGWAPPTPERQKHRYCKTCKREKKRAYDKRQRTMSCS